MNSVKALSLSLCIAVIITSIFSMIAPSERNGKILKLTMSIFILIFLISPFFNIFKGELFDISQYIIQTETNEQNISSILNTTSKSAIYSILKSSFESFGINNDFYIDTEVDYKNNTAILKDVNIYFIGELNIDTDILKEYIQKNVGINVNIK